MNPVARRSKEWIINSLLKLMESKNLDSITIKEIAESADLVRKTFYRHFDSKEDVLLTHIHSLMEEYAERLAKQKDVTLETVIIQYFEFWKEKMDFVVLLQKNGLFVLLLNEIEKSLSQININSEEVTSISLSSKYMYYHDAYMASSIWYFLEKWIKRGCEESPKEIAAIYSDFVYNRHC